MYNARALILYGGRGIDMYQFCIRMFRMFLQLNQRLILITIATPQFLCVGLVRSESAVV